MRQAKKMLCMALAAVLLIGLIPGFVASAEGKILSPSCHISGNVVTTQDFTKIQLIANGKTATYNSGCTDEDGVRTWAINCYYSAGAHTVQMKIRTAVWSDVLTAEGLPFTYVI